MKTSDPRRKLDLWQEVMIFLSARPDLVALTVDRGDPDLLAFVAEGHLDVEVQQRDRPGRVYLRLLALNRPMYVALCGACRRLLGPRSVTQGAERQPRLYLHGIAALVGSDRVGILVGIDPPTEDGWVSGLRPSADVLEAVRTRLSVYQSEVSRWKLERLMAEQRERDLLARLTPEARDKLERLSGVGDGLRAMSEPQPPVMGGLVERLPRAIELTVDARDRPALDQRVEREVRRQPDDLAPPPADGCYTAVVAGPRAARALVLVTWVPHWGLPPYAEVRGAVERVLPGAFESPRLSGAHPPRIAGALLADADPAATAVGSIDLSDPAWLADLEETQEPDFRDREARAARARARLREGGFEAVAWYQSHHHYSESCWGIYFDAEGLDDLACAVAEDLVREGFSRRPWSTARRIVLGLVLEHEVFHARVDAALTWAELIRGRAVYRPYCRGVYVPTWESPGALEEALANFWSWTWLVGELTEGRWKQSLADDERRIVQRVVQAMLDLSPAGYRDWRRGGVRETWRQLGTQALRGTRRPLRQGIGLPLESLIRDDLPLAFALRDVPLHVVGEGEVVRALLTSPATFNVPSRAELRRALEKFFDYKQIVGQGKGSHDKFRGPDGRMFPLPQRDPVSRTVFANFLQHFGMSKADYIGKVRPAI